MLAVIGLFFMFPTILAFRRGHPHKWLLFVGNCILGVTCVGWFVLSVIAATCHPERRSA
jgi:hypothetical protein